MAFCLLLLKYNTAPESLDKVPFTDKAAQLSLAIGHQKARLSHLEK